MSILLFLILVVIFIWAVGLFYLKGPDLSAYDTVADPNAIVSFSKLDGPSAGHAQAVASLNQFQSDAEGLSRKARLAFMRQYLDDQGRKREYSCEFRPVDAGGVPAEWVLADGADGSRRFLYIHGGAFIGGSPLSHRNITSQLAERCRAAVLSIDYRLMPEHRRIDGIEDCRTAYRWILENGPDGPQPLQHLVIGGDSAGGNLSLSLSAWVRDQGMRAPDAVVAFSPTVDGTFSGPSVSTNLESDIMLGPLFSALLKIPLPLRNWVYVLQHRHHPSNPLVSPIFGDLAGLPPTLIQVSEAEMLLDDARRYVNKARVSGTRAVAQSWAHMLHVWQIFYPEVREADEAFDEVRKFVESTG